MNDRQLVLELCNRLNLNRHEPVKDVGPPDNTFYETPTQISLGCGSGYTGFEIRFEFDGDKITGHAIIE